MKKFILLTLLFISGFVILNSSAGVNASSVSVIDIGGGEMTESGTEQETTESGSDKSSGNKFGVVEDTTGETTTENTSDGKTTVFSKDGKETMDETLNSNSLQIMEGDWQFGDDVLPEVESEGFFEHVYNKLWSATTGLQKIVCIFAVIFMLLSLVMILVSAIGNRAKLAWYLLSFLISAIVFTCSLYAPQIMSAFNNWFVSD